MLSWVKDVTRLTKPKNVFWFDGSDDDTAQITKSMLDRAELIKLNESEYKNCYLFRNLPDDVARVKERTFICTKTPEEAGPTNNWMSIIRAKTLLNELFDGVMLDKEMYIIPYLLGPEKSKYSRWGVEATDSPLVALTTAILTKAGKTVLEEFGDSGRFVRGIHSTGNLKKENRYICHFPDEELLMSINTNYGGNASLSKKPHALRLASFQAKKEGWLAEHMFILELEDPNGKCFYISGALPSASGKTNLAMIRPPKAFNDWKIRTVGDDIAWIHCSDEGSTVGINPEHGFFGVAYDTGPYSNPNILECIKKNTLFTNVGLTTDNKPWWEGLTEEVPKNVIDWTGKRWASNSKAPVANKNSRYATKIDQYSLKSKNYNLPDGVPISIILFGGRRANLVPLVYEAYNWEHGILIGAMMRAETTTAISGKVGQLRHDPMGMMDFCGYNMGDYFAHWIEFGKKLKTKPRIFFVNWFRKDGLGNYLWPGFSENFRILKWMVDRVENGIDAVSTPIGYIPKVDSIDLTGLDIKKETVEELLKIDKDGWLKELSEIKEFFYEFDGKIPNELWNEYYKLEKRLIESQ